MEDEGQAHYCPSQPSFPHMTRPRLHHLGPISSGSDAAQNDLNRCTPGVDQAVLWAAYKFPELESIPTQSVPQKHRGQVSGARGWEPEHHLQVA